MALFNAEADFYAPFDETLSQGDLILAPTVLLEPGEGDIAAIAPSVLGEERFVKLWTNSTGDVREAPTTSARALWDVAMVLPHECALEKEFNERVSDMMRSGHGQEEAERVASEDTALDRWIAVAPVRPYADLPSQRRQGVREGQRLGTFPVLANSSVGIEEGWVDLNRITTLDRMFIVPPAHIAKLSVLAVAYLRAALAKHWAYRDLTRYDELSRAIGRTVVDIHAVRLPKNRLRVDLILDADGGSLTFEGSANAPPR